MRIAGDPAPVLCVLWKSHYNPSGFFLKKWLYCSLGTSTTTITTAIMVVLLLLLLLLLVVVVVVVGGFANRGGYPAPVLCVLWKSHYNPFGFS